MSGILLIGSSCDWPGGSSLDVTSPNNACIPLRAEGFQGLGRPFSLGKIADGAVFLPINALFRKYVKWSSFSDSQGIA